MLDTGQAGISFGDGPRIVSVGATAIRTAFGPVDFHVLPTKTPFLLSLADMDRLGLFFNNQTNEVVRDDIRVPAVRKWGHAWFHLARLHRLLRCAGHDDIDEQSIREITRMCHHCQINGTSPQRFRFTLRDDREFNFEITADVVQIGGKPVLHVIDEATAFQGARQVPIEAHNSIGKVEKAHGPPPRLRYPPSRVGITAVKKYHRDPQAPSSQPHDDSQPNPRRVDPNAPPNPDQDDAPAPVLLPEQRRRGRPKGSKNKPKTGVANLSKKEGVFEFIRFDPVAHKGQRLFKAYEKSRLSKTPLNPESGLHWFVTYYRHHPAGFGMVAMQTDDTLLLASPEFAAAEEKEIQKAKLRSKPRSQLSAATPRQKGQGQKLATIFLSSTDRAQQYAQQRARGAYIASICQPEATSQLGFVIVLANEEQSPADFTIRGNVLHWSSTKSKRVTRSVLASEIYGMVQGFDMAIVIATTLQAIVKQLDLPRLLIVCTDSYSLYECLVKLGTTKEKRLMIDIMALRQSYEQREMAEIPPNRALERLIETNRLTIRVEGYVQRPVTADTT
ncbi:polyprotein [Hirsutella rhossiliensis]|uniref:Polyprotein n=1 Tax=Hirsutella rhossiliensis TaxID=111463 RepID=A0A9P8MPK5_9HYPO|nr:polyprotein [Hirsutella rhossiliensis]KAH0959378.1 polyprotein [Hirsutella rhossiliensis]